MAGAGRAEGGVRGRERWRGVSAAGRTILNTRK